MSTEPDPGEPGEVPHNAGPKGPFWKRASTWLGLAALAAVVGLIVTGFIGRAEQWLGLKDEPQPSPAQLVASLRATTVAQLKRTTSARDISYVPNVAAAPGTAVAFVATLRNQGEEAAKDVVIYAHADDGVELIDVRCYWSDRDPPFAACPSKDGLIETGIRRKEFTGKRTLLFVIKGKVDRTASPRTQVRVTVSIDAANARDEMDEAFITVSDT